MDITAEEATQRLTKFSKNQQNVSEWKEDPYIHGLCNGIILAIAIIAETTPTFLTREDDNAQEKT